jgi:hypothetical protein
MARKALTAVTDRPQSEIRPHYVGKALKALTEESPITWVYTVQLKMYPRHRLAMTNKPDLVALNREGD